MILCVVFYINSMTTFIFLSNGWLNTGTNSADWWALSPHKVNWATQARKIRFERRYFENKCHNRSGTLSRFYSWKTPGWLKSMVIKSPVLVEHFLPYEPAASKSSMYRWHFGQHKRLCLTLICRGSKDPGWYSSDCLSKDDHTHQPPHCSLPIWKPLDESPELQPAPHINSKRNCGERVSTASTADQMVYAVFHIDTFILHETDLICTKMWMRNSLHGETQKGLSWWNFCFQKNRIW